MPRRIELELTSSREDGTWTWRAAGAKQPKGDLAGELLPAGAEVGDVLRADVDQGVDGITVVAVLAPRAERTEPERLELVGQPEPEETVTTSLARRGPPARDGRRERRPRSRDRTPRRDEENGREPTDDRRRTAQKRAERKERGEPKDRRGPRPERRERPERPARPRPKRLRPGRAHRKALLDGLPEEHRPIAEQVLRGGVPAVRQAVAKQNEQAKAEGRPAVKAEPLEAIAEQLLPGLRSAEWRDRAEAALAEIDELDLRDLRSVVVAADTGARDDESRALAADLRQALTRRVDQEQAAWLQELASTLTDGRVVRALRLSSRPPKAGAPLPPDLAARLTAAATAALSADDRPDRWVTVLDALQFSPVHSKVEPASLPEKPADAVLDMVRKSAGRLPQIAAKFGIEAPAPAPRRGRGRTRRRPSEGSAASATPAGEERPVPPPPAPSASATPEPVDHTEQPTIDPPPDEA